MKVKNLLLAGLAVAAMTACSNDIESIDNVTPPTTKDASMQFGIALPQNTGTRAGEGEFTEGGTEIGIAGENAFEHITIVIDNAGTRDVSTFKYADFKEEPGENNTMLYLKESIPVRVGTATVSAFVNASSDFIETLGTKALKDLKVVNNYKNSIDDLSGKGGIAEDGKFLMSGIEDNQEFEVGAPVPVTVSVNRVAAKLVERSKIDAFVIDYNKKHPSTTTKAPALNITLKNYTFANLLQDTYTLKNNSVIESGLFNAYSSETTDWSSYGTAKNITGPTAADVTENITYCTENLTTTTTKVLYKAVATWGEDAVAKTFYVSPDKTVFLTFNDLKAVYNIEGLSESSTIAEFAARGIKKYEAGVCYYNSDEIGKIARNNVYYLNVTSIADLGEPTPGVTPEASTINLKVSIQPWIINVRNIEL